MRNRIRITMKTPDCLDEEIDSLVKGQFNEVDYPSLGHEELDVCRDMREKTYRDILKRWVSNGEYVTLEFDLDNGTARVLNLGE